jgi:alkanesulfonate monooxygenase SsuD/methylene tetrahydromethanopterin reductase-like flavin-dependent oxidoreductase (luciferase family)
MKLGVALPVIDAEVGGDPGAIRDFAQAAEEIGYQDLSVPDHVLGVNAASRPEWGDRNTSADLFQDPFVLFGFLAGCTRAIGFSTQVLVLAQRQAVLVAKQAACLDVLCGGRFRLGIGVGWNEVEFVGLNEAFHNRGRRSEEQVSVMKALWAHPHVTFHGKYHTIEDAGIRCPRSVPFRFGSGGMLTSHCAESPAGAMAGCRSAMDRATTPGQRLIKCALTLKRRAAIHLTSESIRE